MYIRGALRIGLVAPVKPFHPYLVDDLAPLLDLHYLRISPWLWFSAPECPRISVAVRHLPKVDFRSSTSVCRCEHFVGSTKVYLRIRTLRRPHLGRSCTRVGRVSPPDRRDAVSASLSAGDAAVAVVIVVGGRGWGGSAVAVELSYVVGASTTISVESQDPSTVSMASASAWSMVRPYSRRSCMTRSTY